jgi:hypothetical protein
MAGCFVEQSKIAIALAELVIEVPVLLTDPRL